MLIDSGRGGGRERRARRRAQPRSARRRSSSLPRGSTRAARTRSSGRSTASTASTSRSTATCSIPGEISSFMPEPGGLTVDEVEPMLRGHRRPAHRHRGRHQRSRARRAQRRASQQALRGLGLLDGRCHDLARAAARSGAPGRCGPAAAGGAGLHRACAAPSRPLTDASGIGKRPPRRPDAPARAPQSAISWHRPSRPLDSSRGREDRRVDRAPASSSSDVGRGQAPPQHLPQVRLALPGRRTGCQPARLPALRSPLRGARDPADRTAGRCGQLRRGGGRPSLGRSARLLRPAAVHGAARGGRSLDGARRGDGDRPGEDRRPPVPARRDGLRLHGRLDGPRRRARSSRSPAKAQPTMASRWSR